ncbi:MAG: signal peptidase I [Bifidobacteriaceae bacterium]|jgi:signal peptidase I|nr:signal peptidase I [Bifidobacteriaceae bacterium]
MLRGGARHGSGQTQEVPLVYRSIWADIGLTLLATLVASFVLKTFVIQSFYIPTQSMEPTLQEDDRVVVSKLAPGPLTVHRGDIVVFRDPGGWSSQNTPLPEETGVGAWLLGFAQALGLAPVDSDDYLIKRVIGVAGDEVACAGEGAPVTVNGVPLDETYIMPDAEPSISPFSVVVPPDALWVMGDNRPRSADSRFHQDQELGGAIALDGVVGVAMVRLWPLDRLSLLRNPGQVFAAVPDAARSGG